MTKTADVKHSAYGKLSKGSVHMPSSSLPLDAYKAIIDQLVNETTHSVLGRHVAECGIFPEAFAAAAFNQLIGSLTPEQRKLLAEMLHEEPPGTIHDVLAMLTWWILSQGLGFTFRGQPMPAEWSGMGLHGDGRRQG